MVNVNLETTATTTQGSSPINVDFLELLINDGAVDITFGFDKAITSGNTRTLKPGEYIKNEEIEINTLYYKTTSSTAAFRMWGKRINFK